MKETTNKSERSSYYQRTKRTASKYKQDIRTAYDIGYAKGWEDAYDVPKRFGSRIAAAHGYKKGIRNRYRSDKYVKQYQKYGKKN